jgi:uncharacterized membrane protein YsdA (DUF1294 family)
LKGVFAVCTVIGVAVAVRRIVALSTPPNPALPPQMAGLDAAFAAHAMLTYLHILCALLFVLLLPFLFLRRTRDSVLLERAVFGLGLAVGVSAYAMSRHAVGGWVERSAVLLFNTLFLFALLRAFLYARAGDRARKQRWMLRAIAILLGIATTRPVMGVFFATASRTHLTPAQFFGIAFWIGFSVNTLAIELWLRSGKRTRARERSLV